ncbi:HD domain-containing phosphohydrolase [Marinospirillum sp. MEB164]|uniref:HD domain-containing phosphohydrolase n=1 Tax=Marinospirillum alkalitolerans TaxID=3123374 RepID=A0ABW8PYY4_9GAMM
MLEKLRPGELTVGRKTTIDIYAKGGRLLLSRGAMIANEQQIEVLMERGLVKRDSSQRVDYSSEFKPFRYSNKVNPFLEMEEYESLLRRAFRHTKSQNPGAKEAFYRDIRQLCTQIYGLAQQAPDALLGSIHWPNTRDHSDYGIHHPLQCAAMIAVMASTLQLNSEQTFATLAAALTANLGMLSIQDKLNKQKDPLSEAQRTTIRQHPERSLEILTAMEIKNPVWLRAVQHHHERLDGSGYPQGLKNNAIASEAKLLALADIYIALLSRREYREALPAKLALRKIFAERGTLVGPALTKLFLQQIGLYPPGTAVKLRNGDVAVVTHRGAELQHPICAGIRGINGQAYMHPPRRDTQETDYAIVESLSNELLKPLQPFLFWGLHVRKAIEL